MLKTNTSPISGNVIFIGFYKILQVCKKKSIKGFVCATLSSELLMFMLLWIVFSPSKIKTNGATVENNMK